MRRICFILFAWLALASSASAQLAQMGAGKATVVSYTGPGDSFAYTGWYSCTRGYSGAYASPGTNTACNVSRASDSHACDLLIANSGNIGNTVNCGTGGDNGQSASSFCNATTCSVVKMYDQSGNAHLQTFVAAHLGTLTFNCQSLTVPCVTYAGSQFSNESTTNSLPTTLTVVSARNSNFTTTQIMFGIQAGEFGYQNSANTVFLFGGGSAGNVTASDSTLHAFNVLSNSTSSIINVDGTETATTTSAGTPSNTIEIAAAVNNTSPLFGVVFEAGYFVGTSTLTQRNNVCHNQRLYYGTPGSC